MPRNNVVSNTKHTYLLTSGATITHTPEEPTAQAQETVARVNQLHLVSELHGGEAGFGWDVEVALARPSLPDDEVTADRIRERLGL